MRYAVTDALTNDDLMVLGAAVDGHVLLTGGSGIAMGLPQNFRKAGLLPERAIAASLSAPQGRAGIISGSCSTATRGQIKAAIEAGYPALKVDPLALVSGGQDAAGLAAWALAQSPDKPFLLYSSDDPAEVAAIQNRLGRDKAGETVEHAFAETARLLARGRRLAPARRRRRDLRRGRAGARHQDARDRPRDRPRRALDARGRRAGFGDRAEIRQFRCGRLLPEGLELAALDHVAFGRNRRMRKSELHHRVRAWLCEKPVPVFRARL